MFQSSLFSTEETASWDPYRVRNFLTIPGDELIALNSIPGWCSSDPNGSWAVEGSDKASLPASNSVEIKDSEVHKLGSNNKVISSKDHSIKEVSTREQYCEIENREKVLSTSIIDAIETEAQCIQLDEAATNKLSDSVEFYELKTFDSRKEGQSISKSLVNKARRRSNSCSLNEFSQQVSKLRHSSSLPNIFNSDLKLDSENICHKMQKENINLNQTYTVPVVIHYQAPRGNSMEINSQSEIVKNKRVNEKDKINIEDQINDGGQIGFSQKSDTLSSENKSNTDKKSNTLQPTDLLPRHDSQKKVPEVSNELIVDSSTKLLQNITNKMASDHIKVQIMSNSEPFEVLPENKSEQITPQKEAAVSPPTYEQHLDLLSTNQEDSICSPSIPSGQPVVNDQIVKSPLSQQFADTFSQPNNEKVSGKSQDAKHFSPIQEKAPELKVRKRKHGREKSSKSNQVSKSARKADIYFTVDEIEEMLGVMKLFLE